MIYQESEYERKKCVAQKPISESTGNQFSYLEGGGILDGGGQGGVASTSRDALRTRRLAPTS